MTSSRQMNAVLNITSPGQDQCPLRRCIVTGDTQPPDGMVRFVVGPEGLLCPDLGRELPGRGIWVGCRRNLVDRAVKNRLFARAAKGPVTVPDDMADQVESVMVRRCLDLLGLGKRAGQLTLGFEKVRAILRKDFTAIAITAADGAENGWRKLLSGDPDRVNASGHPDRNVVDLFTVAELSLALGRENVVHAVLRKGGLTDRFLNESRQLRKFRDEPARLA